VCSNFTGPRYGQKEFGCAALLILLVFCTINICAADISQKVISRQLKGCTSTEWQLYEAESLLRSRSHDLMSLS
jgi:hypothetical protein